MASVHFPTHEISDFESFHIASKRVFGFPDFYGMNMNAWIDCLTYLDDGMSRFDLKPHERLEIEGLGTKEFLRRAPDVFGAFIGATAFINRRHVEAGMNPRIMLVFV